MKNAGRISMVEAGDNKGPNYELIYRGGMAVAIALDMETRTATGNKKNLVDIMKTMYLTFGTSHRPYTYQDIIKISSSVAGKDFSGFFSEYVSGVNVLPLNTYFQSAGLEIKQQNGATVIEPGLNTTQQEKRFLEAVLYK
jgi:predicted metalloprotease with PDZ domain